MRDFTRALVDSSNSQYEETLNAFKLQEGYPV